MAIRAQGRPGAPTLLFLVAPISVIDHIWLGGLCHVRSRMRKAGSSRPKSDMMPPSDAQRRQSHSSADGGDLIGWFSDLLKGDFRCQHGNSSGRKLKA